MMAAHHHANFSSAGPLASKEYDRHEDGQRSDTAGAADDQAALASIITQITEAPSQSSPAPAHSGSSSWAIDQTAQPAADNATWKDRFRSLLCCFAPEPAAYGGSVGDPSGLRSGSSTSGMATAQLPAPLASPFALPAPLPPTPPRIWREAVIGPQLLEDRHKKTLVLDLDETLVHSSFKPIPNPDYILPVDIDGKLVDVYVLKRPWLDHFMSTIGPRFEVVVFTASLAKYADPLLDLLDKQRVVRWRLFRESCVPYEGNYVKDLNCLGRELCDVVIVDNSPHSYVFQPDNALPIGTFIDNMEDQELLEIMPVLLKVENVDDVRRVLPGSV